MDAWMHGRMDAWTCGRVDVWTYGRMDGWMDGWMDGFVPDKSSEVAIWSDVTASATSAEIIPNVCRNPVPRGAGNCWRCAVGTCVSVGSLRRSLDCENAWQACVMLLDERFEDLARDFWGTSRTKCSL